MYLGKRKTLNIEEYNKNRENGIKYKLDATAMAFTELEDIINKTQLSKQYFGKSQSWFSQRIHSCEVFNKTRAFKKEEYKQLAEAFRHIAKRLNAHADEIDNAKEEDEEE